MSYAHPHDSEHRVQQQPGEHGWSWRAAHCAAAGNTGAVSPTLSPILLDEPCFVARLHSGLGASADAPIASDFPRGVVTITSMGCCDDDEDNQDYEAKQCGPLYGY